MSAITRRFRGPQPFARALVFGGVQSSQRCNVSRERPRREHEVVLALFCNFILHRTGLVLSRAIAAGYDLIVQSVLATSASPNPAVKRTASGSRLPLR